LSNLVFTDEEVQQFDEINKTNKKIRKADAIVKKIDKRWASELKDREIELPRLKREQVDTAKRLNDTNIRLINKLNDLDKSIQFSIIDDEKKVILWDIIKKMHKRLFLQKRKNEKWLKIALPELDVQEIVQKRRKKKLDKLVDNINKKKQYNTLVHKSIVQEADIRKIRVTRLHKVHLSHCRIVLEIKALKNGLRSWEREIENSKDKIRKNRKRDIYDRKMKLMKRHAYLKQKNKRMMNKIEYKNWINYRDF